MFGQSARVIVTWFELVSSRRSLSKLAAPDAIPLSQLVPGQVMEMLLVDWRRSCTWARREAVIG